MILQFTLSMPNVGSWNGRWSGEANLYAITRSFSGKRSNDMAAQILSKRSFYYNFGDGWGASISAKEINSSQARTVRSKSKGFCGYDWMVDSIVRHGVIYGPTRPEPVAETPAVAEQEKLPIVEVVVASSRLDDDCPF